jgi:hypothetical protein
VLIKNNGGAAISNFDLTLILDGDEVATETCTTSIASMSSATYTFTQTLDLSETGQYEIMVTLNLSGDQNLNNNSKIKKVISFSAEPINLWGYRVADDDYTSYTERGFVSFLTDNPEEVTQMKDYMPVQDATLIQTGEYVNGDWYYFSVDDISNPWTVTKGFVKLNTYTWEETMVADLDLYADTPRDMAYDHTTNTMYAVSYGNLVTVDLTTGELTTVGSLGISGQMTTLACNMEGDLYGTSANGSFYKIYKTLGGAAMLIATTGIANDQQQSMTFDHSTGRLFWTMREANSYGIRNCKLLEINPETGAVLDRGVIGGNSQIIGLYTPVSEPEFYTVYLPEETGVIFTPTEGSTSPVEYNGTYSFTVELEEGYTQSNFVIRANDEVINPEEDVYTIENITEDQYVTIEGVALNQYQIEAKANANGTIIPEGIFTVTYGESKTFEIMPDANYFIEKVEVNGINEGALTTYTFEDIKADGKIEAFFKVDGITEHDNAIITIFSHNNVVTILNETLVPVQQVEILDMYGRAVWVGNAPAAKTEITLNVAVGIYAVRIITNDNQQFITKVNIK